MGSGIVATYCVYEATRFFEESVARIYPLVDNILILLNTCPWNGTQNIDRVRDTYRRILDMEDLERKIITITQHWETQHEERNFGLDFIRSLGKKWCFIIDDDELYNRDDLSKFFSSIDPKGHGAYLFKHLIYWKTEKLVINAIQLALPAMADVNHVVFNDKRSIIVKNGKTWYTPKESYVLCHHMSYVRDDEEIFRKLRQISESTTNTDANKNYWFYHKWLNWNPDTINLHPFNPESFPKAVPVEQSLYRLKNYD